MTSSAVWRDRERTAAERAAALLAMMSLEEKVAQLSSVWLTESAGDFAPAFDDAIPDASTVEQLVAPGGLGQISRAFGTDPLPLDESLARLRRWQESIVAQNRWGIPALVHEECLTGFATFGATAYPTPLAWAATFDDALVERTARAIGDDMTAVGVHQGLSPVLDVVRDYRWGRVEETLGESPVVVGRLGAAYVRGLEAAGIVATLKHFAGYASSTGARNHAPVSMGPREFADVVLPPFEVALRHGGARSVMNSYTSLDGVPAAASHGLLTGLLRDTLGFSGTVVADYWAIPFLVTHHGVAGDVAEAARLALTAGLDVELPQRVAYGEVLTGLVRRGEVAESLVDRSVLRVLEQKARAGLLDGTDPVPGAAIDLDSVANRRLATQLAEESIILLANDDRALPLGGVPWPRVADAPASALPRRIAVVGPVADRARCLMGCYAFPNHVLADRADDDLGIPVRTVLAAIRDEFPGVPVAHAVGATFTGSDDAELRDAAVATAATADLAVVVVGDLSGLFGRGTSGEGCDAGDLRLPGTQHELVTAILATGVPTILVVVSGRPYALGAYGTAGAIVQAFLPGVEGAAAIAGLLSGRVAPSGRLPVQIPRRPDVAQVSGQPRLAGSNPGITALDPSPLFAFGHGLTAAPVDYLALEIDAPVIGSDGRVRLTVDVANTGSCDAVEVVQLYVEDPVAQVVRPQRQLLAYARVELPAGQRRRVDFSVHADLLSFTGLGGDRIVEPGDIVFVAGPSIAHTPLRADLRIDGPVRVVGPDRVLLADVTVAEAAVVSPA